MTRLALAALLIAIAASGGCDKDKIVIIDSPPAMLRCDPRAQTGCEPGEKCARRILVDGDNEVAEIACVPDGTVAIDGVCEYGMAGDSGYSNCKAGSECVSRVCKQICDHQGSTPKCDANHACSVYDDLFESNNLAVAGVCDPRCDPLTQALAVGMNTAACGSTDPAMANNGCYTFDGIDFTCARIPADPARPERNALNRTDRMPALTSSAGDVYVNGCAAGYLPMLIERTGSMVAICSGICAPAKTDSSQPGNALGDANAVVKLHNKAMPEAGDGLCTAGKKGSAAPENCHYMWFYNVSNGVILPSPYNDTTGICFAYGEYTVTLGGSRVGFPDCAKLPPAGAPADPVYGNADDWPCVPSAELPKLTSGKKLNPVANDFHIGARPGPGVRHILRQE